MYNKSGRMVATKEEAGKIWKEYLKELMENDSVRDVRYLLLTEVRREISI